MPAANTPSQNLLFLVAGDSTAAALTALELARQGIPRSFRVRSRRTRVVASCG